MAFQDYDLYIEYCPGKNNVVAVTISRLQGQEKEQKLEFNDGKIFLSALLTKLSSTLKERLQNSREEQKRDLILQQRGREVENKKTNKYKVYDDPLYFINGENKLLCLTKSIIHNLVDECHEMYTHIGPL